MLVLLLLLLLLQKMATTTQQQSSTRRCAITAKSECCCRQQYGYGIGSTAAAAAVGALRLSLETERVKREEASWRRRLGSLTTQRGLFSAWPGSFQGLSISGRDGRDRIETRLFFVEPAGLLSGSQRPQLQATLSDPSAIAYTNPNFEPGAHDADANPHPPFPPSPLTLTHTHTPHTTADATSRTSSCTFPHGSISQITTA